MFRILVKDAAGLYRWPDRPWLPLAFSLSATRRLWLVGVSRGELLFENALLEIGVVIEQQGYGNVEVLFDIDRHNVAHFSEVGNSADRALIGLESLDPHSRLVRQ